MTCFPSSARQISQAPPALLPRSSEAPPRFRCSQTQERDMDRGARTRRAKERALDEGINTESQTPSATRLRVRYKEEEDLLTICCHGRGILLLPPPAAAVNTVWCSPEQSSAQPMIAISNGSNLCRLCESRYPWSSVGIVYFGSSQCQPTSPVAGVRYGHAGPGRLEYLVISPTYVEHTCLSPPDQGQE